MTAQTDSNIFRPRFQGAGEDSMTAVQFRSNSLGELIPFVKGEAALASTALPSLNEGQLDDKQKQLVEGELAKLLQSPLLVQSERLSRFLRFAVEATLSGNTDSVKEYTIGIEAYGRRPDFDPSQDSIVRTEARRLRTKLKKYYEEEGGNDPLLIEFRPGSYVPTFHINHAAHCSSPDRGNGMSPNELPSFAISVTPFTHLSGDTFGEACAGGLTDELMHRLVSIQGVSLIACRTGAFGGSTEARTLPRSPYCMTSEGVVRTEGKRIRVTSRLYDVEGLHVASWRFDVEAKPDELFGALEKIAAEIACSIDNHKALKIAL
jgi:TolB-like protein